MRVSCVHREAKLLVVRLYMVAGKTASSRSQLEKLCSQCVYIPTPQPGGRGNARTTLGLAREWIVLVSRHGARYAYE